ncbi:hypothetical protein [Butyrivibrio sp. AE3004]|uniref:hypothetical protein n=1 Tax=Butyrivibrio sp. AE3004 TaxID=1506994 RepID=UPI000494C5EB|nr:hypothetical protein [Butyrivibrio sp. AE3004]
MAERQRQYNDENMKSLVAENRKLMREVAGDDGSTLKDEFDKVKTRIISENPERQGVLGALKINKPKYIEKESDAEE